jgi:hypothetical protein
MSVMMTAEEVRHHIEYKRGNRELKPEIAERMLAALDAGADPDYMTLWTAASFQDPPPVVYHTAPATLRAEITAHGLQARQPGRGGNWAREPYAGIEKTQPPGVYVAAGPDTRGLWAHWQDWDVWEIRRSDLPWCHDTMNPGCWSLAADVPPGQLRLHGTYGTNPR